MNKRQYQSLVKRAVRAYRLRTDEYEQIMDEAGMALDQPVDGVPDTEWERFCKDVEDGCRVPLTEREKKQIANRERREKIAEAEAQLKYAQQLYDSLTIKRTRRI